jgi:hypothetical protein
VPHRKTCKRFNNPCDAHALTFSCFRRQPFLSKDGSRQWLIEGIDRARRKLPFHVWAYVIMPDHAHLRFGRPSLPITSATSLTRSSSPWRSAPCCLFIGTLPTFCGVWRIGNPTEMCITVFGRGAGATTAMSSSRPRCSSKSSTCIITPCDAACVPSLKIGSGPERPITPAYALGRYAWTGNRCP